MITLDSHTHSIFSPDGHNTIDEMCRAALSRGITYLALTEHTDWDYCHPESGYFDYYAYSRTIDIARRFYPELTLLKGIEFGEVHKAPEAFSKASALELDLVIGSLHRPDFFSLSRTLQEQEHPVERLFAEYFCEARRMVEHGGFDILGHPDLPVRYFYTNYPVSTELEELMSACVAHEIVPEINTSTLRRGFDELMPGNNTLSLYRDCGGRYVSCGSDAHRADDIAADYDALEQAITHYNLIPVYFKNRSMRELPTVVCQF